MRAGKRHAPRGRQVRQRKHREIAVADDDGVGRLRAAADVDEVDAVQQAREAIPPTNGHGDFLATARADLVQVCQPRKFTAGKTLMLPAQALAVDDRAALRFQRRHAALRGGRIVRITGRRNQADSGHVADSSDSVAARRAAFWVARRSAKKARSMSPHSCASTLPVMAV